MQTMRMRRDGGARSEAHRAIVEDPLSACKTTDALKNSICFSPSFSLLLLHLFPIPQPLLLAPFRGRGASAPPRLVFFFDMSFKGQYYVKRSKWGGRGRGREHFW